MVEEDFSLVPCPDSDLNALKQEICGYLSDYDYVDGPPSAENMFPGPGKAFGNL